MVEVTAPHALPSRRTAAEPEWCRRRSTTDILWARPIHERRCSPQSQSRSPPSSPPVHLLIHAFTLPVSGTTSRIPSTISHLATTPTDCCCPKTLADTTRSCRRESHTKALHTLRIRVALSNCKTNKLNSRTRLVEKHQHRMLGPGQQQQIRETPQSRPLQLQIQINERPNLVQ